MISMCLREPIFIFLFVEFPRFSQIRILHLRTGVIHIKKGGVFLDTETGEARFSHCLHPCCEEDYREEGIYVFKTFPEI